MSSTPIQLTGNLTRDPELRWLPSVQPVARVDVAVSSRRRTAAGEWVDGDTTPYQVSVWGELAPHVAESFTPRRPGAHPGPDLGLAPGLPLTVTGPRRP